MKKILILSLLLFLYMGTFAQGSPRVQVTNIAFKKTDDIVRISFDVTVGKLSGNYKLTLTPVVYAGKDSLRMHPITIMSRKKRTLEKREGHLLSGDLTGLEGKKTTYRANLPFEPWMNTLSLRVDEELEGCCNEKSLPARVLVADKQIYYKLIPQIGTVDAMVPSSDLQRFDSTASFLYPASDYNRHYEIFEHQREKGALVINFGKGSARIDPSFQNNKATLAQVNQVLDLIEATPTAALKKIVIIGMTSPEGTLTANNALAEKRANALKYWVGERVAYNPNLFEIINGSEDWDGLRQQVEASRMPDRWQVLEIINKYSVTGGREKKLMDLRGGVPYRYMAEHFFPQLRNAGYVQIYYELKPDKDIEILNEVIGMMNSERYADALVLLAQVSRDKPTDNLVGVCHMMLEQYDQAAAAFNKAILRGDSKARVNLENMRKSQLVNN